MRLQPSLSGRRRRGMILLIVLVMLTLFVIAGITFVLLANVAAESSSLARQSETEQVADMDPNTAFNYFLGQLVYGTTNDSAGAGSSLRGHSLAETMYGSFDAQGNVPMDAPYVGTGRLHSTQTGNNQDEYILINYKYFAADGWIHDPGRYGNRADPTKPYPGPDLYTGGQNAPYTYPDLNSMFLATVNAQTGQVLAPSYYRKGVFNPNGLGQPLLPNGQPNPNPNPNWTNAQGKYLTLRPRPQENPGFPYPTAANGQPDPNDLDLSNLPGSTSNDSQWMDVNSPVMTTASGLQYKMLVAPLILDLDSRINLNVVGNILAGGNGHASNQGWGPWEISMDKVLVGGEWQNLFHNYATSRYGPGGYPLSVFALAGPAPHVYGQGDLNGLVDPNPPPGAFGGATGRYSLPGQAPAAPYQCFPAFPAGYGNNQGGTLEITTNGSASGTPNHPMFFNPMFAQSGNKLFTIQNNASILWAGTSASASAGSDLVTLCGQPTQSSFNSVKDPSGTMRRINQTTVLSMDIDRAGAAPSPTPSMPYGLAANPPYPTATAAPFPAAVSPPRGPTPGNEFDPATWRSTLPGMFPRINLDRKLTDYPIDPASHQINPADPLYAQATNDRQQFAQDIFNRLTAVTGATTNPMPAVGTPDYNALRWLAQLAANIVDYIDTDDVMTPFNWDPARATQPDAWVFGTELPKLVVNEAYFQYNNGVNGGAADPGQGLPTARSATLDFRMNVWVELLNPLPADPNPNQNAPFTNSAQLQYGANPSIYQVVLAQSGDPSLKDPKNTTGAPTTVLTSPDGTPATVKDGDFSGGGNAPVQQVVLPVNQAYNGPAASNQGFYLLGPAPAGGVPAEQGMPAVTLGSQHMTYTVPLNAAGDNPAPPAVLLRRLANPYLPPNPTVGPGYNPYVTVDYVDLSSLPPNQTQPTNPAINDARQYKFAPQNNPPLPPQPYTAFASYGRTQPYAADVAQWRKQQPSNVNNGPQQTFFQHNAVEPPPGPPSAGTPNQTLKVPFDWLVHLDRPLISPVELLQVSGFKPHELTQRFVQPDANPPAVPFGDAFSHRAPWATDQNARIYRLLEYVKVKNPTPGIAEGGRVPGKININTLDGSINLGTGLPNSIEVFRALCDAQTGNSFSAADVDQVFTTLMKQRTPNGVPGQNDQPFWGMGMGPDPGSMQYPPPGAGIANTLLGSALTNGTPTNPAITHPYQKLEMLNKIYNNLTTRSNCFAVWLTVGFFQVNPATGTLGAEVNLAQGKNIRHHMFAIVDRTQVQTFATTSKNAITIPGGQTQVAASVILQQNPVPDNRTGRSWQVQPGATLVYDANTPNEETVVVQPGMTANFTLNHAANAPVISRGHPGPWLNYNASQDGAVVPYVVLID